MAKVNQPYTNLLGGVSQQDAAARKPNQHWAQTNMLADPKRGLTRRPGSRRVAEALSGAPPATNTPSISSTRGYDFRVRGVDYTLFAPFEGNDVVRDPWPDMVCVRKDPGVAGGALVPVSFVGNATRTDALKSRGVAAAASLGSVLVMSCLDPAALPAYTTSYLWQTANNLKRHVVWIRGGAYSRTYSMALVRGNQKFFVEYTTRQASYPEVLDTSDLFPTDPDYLKQVNDRTNAYNTAATQWIGAALADATPENVAQKLADALILADFLSPTGTVTVSGSTIQIIDDSVDDVETNDGGDNSLMRGVGNTVTAAELLSTRHYPGKIVRVRPNAATDGNVFFMEAVAKDGSSGAFTDVSWEESPGVQFTPTEGLFFATVEGGTCYVASSPASLRSAAGIDFPDFIPSVCGDDVTSPVPKWLDEGITYLGLFQDRLIVGGRNEVATSKTGDYLNFWRGSVLTVAKNDPVRFIIIGGEDDILRHSVMYDRNLVIFGDKRQYLIDGRKAFEPNTASATVMASFPDACGAPPVLSGNFLFYARSRDGITTLHQFAPGQIAESPESSEVSDNLEDYIVGNPIELVAGTMPKSIYIRTDASPNTIYVYSYEDDASGTQRKSAAWSRWDYHWAGGPIMGLSLANGFLYMLRYRQAWDTSEWVAVDRQPLTADNIAHPYLDSATTRGPMGVTGEDDPEFGAGLPAFTMVNDNSGVPYNHNAAACGAEGNYVGTEDANCSVIQAAANGASVWEGYSANSYVTLSSPFFRDVDGRAMLEGRLTVSNIKFRLTDTGGIGVQVNTGIGANCWAVTLHGDYDPTPVDLDATVIGPDCPPDAVTVDITTGGTSPVLQGQVAYSAALGYVASTALTGTNNRYLTSPDGVTWTYQTDATLFGSVNQSAASPTKVVSNSNNQAALIHIESPSVVYTTTTPLTGGAFCTAIAYLNGAFIVGGWGGSSIHLAWSATGADGSWTLASYAGFPGVTPPQCFGYSTTLARYVMFAVYGVHYSSDRVTWAAGSVASQVTGSLTPNSVAFGNGIFVATGSCSGGTTTDVYSLTSTDGITWVVGNVFTSPVADGTERCGYVIFADGVFLVTAAATADGTPVNLYSSADGLTWTLEGLLPGNLGESLVVGTTGVVGLALGEAGLVVAGTSPTTSLITVAGGGAPGACGIDSIVGPTVPVTGGCEDDFSITGESSAIPLTFGKDQISMSDVSAGTGVIEDAAAYQVAELVVPIGRETRDYRLTLSSYLWAPLTIAAAEWTGQYFNRTRRVQGG